MINQIAKITLFVDNMDEAKAFWTEKLHFTVRLETKVGAITWLEVAPNENAQTTFVLYDKQRMLEQNPSANVCHPSVILSCNDVPKAHDEMKASGISLNKIQDFPYGKMFTFYDQDGNEYLLRED